PCCRSRTWADAQVDAVAVAIAVLAGPFIFDAAPPLERIVSVTPADAPALGLPRPAHQHALAGTDRTAIRQGHRDQHFSGARAGLKRATQRDADQLATELLGRDGFGHGGARNTRQQADEHNDGQTDGHESTHGSYNIEGSTRSGGLWPSMNVLMLMMT